MGYRLKAYVWEPLVMNELSYGHRGDLCDDGLAEGPQRPEIGVASSAAARLALLIPTTPWCRRCVAVWKGSSKRYRGLN